jgi:hypothetical protein
MQVKPLKELAFNSPDITAGMTSRQFQVMMDVLTNLLFARAPRYSVYNASILAFEYYYAASAKFYNTVFGCNELGLEFRIRNSGL